jgi:hypothetical protein
LIGTRDLVVEYSIDESRARRSKLVALHMHFTARELAQAACVIEVEVPEENYVNVLCGEPQLPQVVRNPLVLAHRRRLK